MEKDDGNQDYQEIVNEVVKMVQEKIQSIIGVRMQSTKTCWAGVNECTYQKKGDLLEVNSRICNGCTDIKFFKEKLFDRIKEIFVEQLKEVKEEGREEGKANTEEGEKERIKTAIIEGIEKIPNV